MKNQTNSKTFRKSEKLKSKKEIDLLFKNGKAITQYPLQAIFYTTTSPTYKINIGFSVSKRLFKLAVKRNFIKRKIKEAFRLNKQLIAESDFLENKQLICMFVYKSKNIESFQTIEEKMKTILKKIALHKDQNKKKQTL